MRKTLLTALLAALLFSNNVSAQAIPYPHNYDTTSSGASSAQFLGDVKNSPYFKAPDYYNLKSNNKGLTILNKYKTYQQTTEFTCGGAAALTVLHHYGNDKFDELQISKLMGTNYARNASNELGTSTKQMVDFFKSIGWRVDSSLERADKDGVSFANIEDFTKFVQENLKNNRPVMVENMYWGGHWRVIIGYDTMNTPQLHDDVLIFMDSYDTQDHKQDGYGVQTLAGFYYTWVDQDVMPKSQRIQQWLVATPE